MFLKNLPLVFLMIVFLLSCKVYSTIKSISYTQPTTEKPVDKIAEQRVILADKADDYLGKKYSHAGQNPKSGFDCSGYTYFLMKQIDVSLPRNSAAQSKVGQKVPLTEAQAGDLVFFQKGKKNRIFHVAMVYSNKDDDLQIIHSTSSRGVVIDDLYNNKYWSAKISHARNVLAQNTP